MENKLGGHSIKDIQQYLTLLEMTYDDAVIYLLKKYGPAMDDYFRENSYKRFFNDEIKSITKGDISRTSEGLYCHHIEENRYLKMADFNYIKEQNIPFNCQTKDRLVYCNLVEHTVLHALIAKETHGEYGAPGLNTYLIPMVVDWYIHKNVPKTKWQLNCYKASYLSSKEAKKIINEIYKFINQNSTLKQSRNHFFTAFWNGFIRAIKK